MYNKTIIEFGFRMISWIIKTSCLYYLPQPSASADNTDLAFDNSWYHAQPHPIIVYYSSYGKFWYFWGDISYKEVTNSTGIRANWINCDVVHFKGSAQLTQISPAGHILNRAVKLRKKSWHWLFEIVFTCWISKFMQDGSTILHAIYHVIDLWYNFLRPEHSWL